MTLKNVEMKYWTMWPTVAVHLVLGIVWYIVFQAPFMAVLDKPVPVNHLNLLGTSALVALVHNFVLIHIIAMGISLQNDPKQNRLVAGMMGAFWCWLGFVAMTGIPATQYEHRSLMVYILNTFYMLVSMLISGAILGEWGVIPKKAN